MGASGLSLSNNFRKKPVLHTKIFILNSVKFRTNFKETKCFYNGPKFTMVKRDKYIYQSHQMDLKYKKITPSSILTTNYRFFPVIYELPSRDPFLFSKHI